MISLQDLEAAIAECQGVPNPKANTCIKLAAFLTIKEALYGDYDKRDDIPNYSYSTVPDEQVITFNSGTAFSDRINGKPVKEVIVLFDEVMDTLQALNPPLYASIMRKL